MYTSIKFWRWVRDNTELNIRLQHEFNSCIDIQFVIEELITYRSNQPSNLYAERNVGREDTLEQIKYKLE